MSLAARNSMVVPMIDYIWTGVVALALIVYLLYALLKPEKF